MTSRSHTLKSLEVLGFRGQRRKIRLNFDRHANFIIGRNGTGKTTLINLLNAAIALDTNILRKVDFDQIEVKFKLDGSNITPSMVIKKINTKNERSIVYSFKSSNRDSTRDYVAFRVAPRKMRLSQAGGGSLTHYVSLEDPADKKAIIEEVSNLIKVTWLSLRRRREDIIDVDDEYDDDPYPNAVSDVDQRLEFVFNQMSGYFSRLDRVAADENIQFQKQWFIALLTPMLANHHLHIHEIDSDLEKRNIEQIFRSFGVPQSEVIEKLSSHFQKVDEFKNRSNDQPYRGFEEISTLVNAIRLHNLVDKWQNLQKKIKEIYKPRELFKEKSSSMLYNKDVKVNSSNAPYISHRSESNIPISELSSGEKQLLIFLSETILQEGERHIFLADEPELSLHVEWQEQLVPSLLEINPNAQVVFATHSPDIVGSFQKSVVKMENLIDDF
ncbi:AAA family ATPase [Sphingopyxis sp.]|jgi:predicted ATP-binding protein involved in virulence|uniref:AAA family ATPase n=1 Tax=Sphingopyxis sp. TaxID=1908224 RepID=UPI002DF3272E|nr:AAA family ATPase [Sphingopyxis sp.]